MKFDEIEIRRLEVSTCIGVPDEERVSPQKIWISVWMRVAQGFGGIADQVAKTVDYAQVAGEIEALAATKHRHLIETMATDVADHLLRHHPLKSVAVKVEKRILPNADFVAVKIRREV